MVVVMVDDATVRWTDPFSLSHTHVHYTTGQTKFKTAAVEYIRTMGLVPRVIASSNHLGNNDMRNLSTSKATATAKLRVKHDIFAPVRTVFITCVCDVCLIHCRCCCITS